MRTADLVDEYLDLGWSLCAIRPGEKRPLGSGWQLRATDRELWERYPDHGVGLIHHLSGTCALDLDDLDASREMLAKIGIDVDDLLAAGVQIVSGRKGRAKLLYRAPDGVELARVNVTRGRGKNAVGAYELRGGVCQDVLPPTIHPTTGRAYQWVGDYADLPELPAALLEHWLDRLAPERVSREAQSAPVRAHADAGGVIGQFNRDADIGTILEEHDYTPCGSRWCAPQSTSGDPGVVLLPDADPPRVYSHHGSDPLGDGYAHDAFSIWTILEHGGDAHAAVREAGRYYDAGADPMIEQWVQAQAASRGNVVALPVSRREDPETVVHAIAEDLPEDPGPCPVQVERDLERWLARQLNSPKPGAVRQGVLSFLCAFTGRRYVTPYGHTCSAYLAITDTSVAGMREIKPILYELAARLGERSSIRGTGVSSASALHKHLMRCPRLYWITDELGHMARMARRQQSGALESAIAVLFELYDGRTLLLDPDSGGGRRDKPIEECDVYSPSAAVLAMIPHDLLGALAQRGEYGRGSLQQLLVAEAGDGPDEHEREHDIPDPALVHSLAERIRDTGTVDSAANAPGIRPSQTEVHIDEGAHAELRALRGRLLGRLDHDHLRRWRGMAHGYHQSAIRIACTLAAWENPSDPTVNYSVAAWTARWVERCLAEAVPRIDTADTGDAMDVYQRVMAVLVDGGGAGLTAREIARRCRPFRSLDGEKRASLLRQMVEDGCAGEVATPHTVRYTLGGVHAK